MAERHRVPEDVHLRIGLRLGIHALLGELLDFQRHDVGRFGFAARDAAKIFFGPGSSASSRLEIADQNQA